MADEFDDVGAAPPALSGSHFVRELHMTELMTCESMSIVRTHVPQVATMVLEAPEYWHDQVDDPLHSGSYCCSWTQPFVPLSS